MAKQLMKNVVVSMQRVVQVSCEEEVAITCPQNVSDEDLRHFIETHITCEPWISFAEISVTGDYDGEDWNRLSVAEIDGVTSSASTPEVTIARNTNGDLTIA